MGRKNRGLTDKLKKFSIFVTKENWDRLNFLADGENKTVSRYVADKCLNSTRIHEYEPEPDRIRKSLCMNCDEWAIIKQKADELELSLSNYIFSVI